MRMLTFGNLTFWLVTALASMAVWQLLGKHLFSAGARERRRRNRNYGRVVSRRHRPTVRLAVRVP
jgi:hypothetical protein